MFLLTKKFEIYQTKQWFPIGHASPINEIRVTYVTPPFDRTKKIPEVHVMKFATSIKSLCEMFCLAKDKSFGPGSIVEMYPSLDLAIHESIFYAIKNRNDLKIYGAVWSNEKKNWVAIAEVNESGEVKPL